MTDIVDKNTRSRMMSGIQGKNTKPELTIRNLLHKEGFRYRLYDKILPGKPDLVLKKYRVVIFINGCFWHRHDCKLFKWPKTREEFWKEKLNKNAQNDALNQKKLSELGWRICIVWECSIRGADKDLVAVKDKIVKWILSDSSFLEVRE